MRAESPCWLAASRAASDEWMDMEMKMKMKMESCGAGVRRRAWWSCAWGLLNEVSMSRVLGAEVVLRLMVLQVG